MRHWKSGSLSIAVLLIVLTAWPAFAQQVKMPRAKSPLLLFGFEGADAMKSWRGSGLKPEITKEHVSEGTQAMTFTVPKHDPGGLDYPMATIDWDNGKGYSTKDWSHHGKIAFDVWVDGNEPRELSIELRNKPGDNGISERFTIQPGKKNSIEISDALGVIDSSDIEEFLFFAGMNRPSAYKVTIDNVRLIPGDKSPIAEFDLAYPNYRNTIFPTAKNATVTVTVQSQEYDVNTSDLTVKLTASAGNKIISRKTKMHGDTVSISVPVRKLPTGAIELSATLMNTNGGKILATQKWTAKKIGPAEVRAMKSYIDAYNNLIVDGKPFFPIGWYTDSSDSNVDEVANTPFNCILSYAMDQKSKADMLKYMDRVEQKGLKLIYCMNDLYPTATYVDSWEGIKGNDAIAEGVVKACKDHPAIISWYMIDELPRKLLPSLEDYYRRVSTQDAGHPCYIVLYNMSDIGYFTGTTDVLGSDPYPVPSSPVTQVSDETDITVAAGHGHRAVWQVLQAFAWYQHNSTNPDRKHIPTPEELQTGRAPSYEEGRCMTYLALTHGSKGILYWCYYDMKQLPQYNEMWTWMKTIGAEVKTLSPMLLSHDDLGTVRNTQSNVGIHTKLKRYKGELYLMAVNADKKPCTVTFDLAKELSGDAKVMFENRSVTMSGNQLTDSFKPLEAHVYSLGKETR